LLEIVGANPILTVRDTETSSSSTSTTLRLAESGGGDSLGTYWDIKHNPNAALSFLAGTTERMRIDSSGNVGIGTTSPSRELEVTGSGNVYVKVTAPTANDSAGIELANTGATWLIQNDDTSSEALTFDRAGTERMRIDSSGKVGIGTTSPSHKLQVSGSNSAARFSDDGTGYNLDIEHDTSSGITTLQQTNSGGDLRLQGGSASGLLMFDTGGSERMRIDSSGRVLLNRTAATGSLTLESQAPSGFSIGSGFYSSATGSTIEFKDSNTTANYKVRIGAYTDDMVMFAGGSERMRIDSSGNVGIGTTSPSRLLYVQESGTGSSRGISINTATAGGNAGIGFATGGTDRFSIDTVGSAGSEALRFYSWTSSAERMRIDSSGNLLVGTTTAGGKQTITQSSSGGIGSVVNFSGSGGVGYHGKFLSSVGTAYFGWWKYNGSVVGSITSTGSSTSYNTSSDYRLKENVVELTGATERLKQLNPSRFNFIADADTTVDGFLAHEVADVVPEAISGEKDAVDADGNPEYQGIDQSKLVPLLVATIQELEARITQLENN
jgi:hypothetical protein